MAAEKVVQSDGATSHVDSETTFAQGACKTMLRVALPICMVFEMSAFNIFFLSVNPILFCVTKIALRKVGWLWTSNGPKLLRENLLVNLIGCFLQVGIALFCLAVMIVFDEPIIGD